MATARELLDDLRNTKRNSCMSEYTNWINEVVEYLEQEAHNEQSRGEDPTITSQMELMLDVPPSIRDGYEDAYHDILAAWEETCTTFSKQ